MSIPPIALGLVFSHGLALNEENREISLDGVFGSLQFASFPTAPIQMSAFTLLTNGRGEGELQLEMLKLFGSKAPVWIYRQKKWFKSPVDPLVVVNVEFVLRRLIIPGPGEYLAVLSFDKQHVTERRLVIYQERNQK